MTETVPPEDAHRDACDALLRATLPHIAFDGWTGAALRAGARDADIDPARLAVLFPDPTIDAVTHFADMADRDMLRALNTADLPGMKVRERIAACIRTRLTLFEAHKEAVRLAVGVLTRPHRAALATGLTAHTVHAMWRAAGDASTDYNWYTKRALLAGVYGATLLYWLEDTSDGHRETWDFLDRRIADVMRIPRIGQRAGKVLNAVSAPFRLARRLTPSGPACKAARRAMRG